MYLFYDYVDALSANGLSDVGGDFGGDEFGDKKEAEVGCGAGAARSEQVAVGHGAFVGEDGG